MASVNRVILVGNLGRDPEARYGGDGSAIVNATLATTDSWRDKSSGERKEATEWHRLVFFGKLAEIASQYLKKGSQIYLEGRLRSRKWQDKDGQERQTTEIVVEEMKMLGSRQGSDESPSPAPDKSAPPPQGGAKPSGKSAGDGDPNDWIPF